MRVTVLGAGAVGCLLGGLCGLAGHTIRFLSRQKGPHPEGARDVRISLKGGWHTFAGAAGDAMPAGQADAPADEILLVCLGRQHVRELKRDALADFGGAVFCNTDPREPGRLGKPAGGGSSLCATLLSAVTLQDRDVEMLAEDPTLIVESGSAGEELFRDLGRFGVRVQPVSDVVPYLNSLFVYQLLFLPVALCNTTIAHFLSFPEGRELAGLLLQEGLRTMEKTGRQVARLPAFDPGDLLARLGKGVSGGERYSPDRSYPPALTDLIRGKPTEARELNKRVVEMAAEAGLELTWNWRVFQKAGRTASVGFYRDPGELMRSLV